MNELTTSQVKSLVGPGWTVRMRCAMRGLGLPRWGNLRRTSPFSDNFGFDRGTPVDRYYLHKFLDSHRSEIRGRVLEIQLPGYTRQYGSDLSETHSIDISSDFQPTYACDLALADDVIPSNYYDCFLLPNTLCVLRDIESSLRNALRVVRPGGVVLATTAAFVPLTPGAPDYWHLSAAGWQELAGRVWKGNEFQVESHGNCLAAVASMLGLAQEELSPAELDVRDDRYPVLITLRCQKTQ